MNDKEKDQVCLRFFRLRYDELTDTSFADEIIAWHQQELERAVAEALQAKAYLDLKHLEVSHALHKLPYNYVKPLKYALEVQAGITNKKEGK